MKWTPIAIALMLAATLYAANELSTQTQATFSKNGSTYQIALAKQTSVTGNFASDVVLDVGTLGTAVSFGSALPVGLVVLQNITTNAGRTVSYGTNSAALFGIIQPGDHARFALRDGTNLFIQADLTNCNVRVFGVSQ